MRPKQKITGSDVARLAGVSQATVSKVANNSVVLTAATRAKVIQAAHELGYPLTPRSRGGHHFALVFPGSAITGYSSGEVVGKLSQFDLIPPESRAHYMLQVNNAFSRGDVAYLKHELLCRDGSRIWVVCYGKRYYDSAEKAFRSEILIFRATGADGLEDLQEEAS